MPRRGLGDRGRRRGLGERRRRGERDRRGERERECDRCRRLGERDRRRRGLGDRERLGERRRRGGEWLRERERPMAVTRRRWLASVEVCGRVRPGTSNFLRMPVSVTSPLAFQRRVLQCPGSPREGPSGRWLRR